MTVSQLIEKLKEAPQDAKVYFYDNNYLDAIYLNDIEIDSDGEIEIKE